MDAGAVVALIGVAVTLVISIIALVQSNRANREAERSATASERSALASERGATSSEEQTTLQQAVARQAAEPAIWVDIRPDDQQGEAIMLLVGNSGPTVATDVVVQFDPPLRDTPMQIDAAHRGEERLNKGLSSLPPGRTLAWMMGVAHVLLNENSTLSYVVTIDAVGPLGKIPTLSYTIDLHDIAQGYGKPRGTLNGVTEAVRDVTKTLGKLGKSR